MKLNLKSIEEALTIVTIGSSAASLLAAQSADSSTIPRTKSGLMVLPPTVWLPSQMAETLSNKAESGSLPCQISWSRRIVSILNEEEIEKNHHISFSIEDWGHSIIGSAVATKGDRLAPGYEMVFKPSVPTSVPKMINVHFMRRSELMRALRQMVEAGNCAKWEIVKAVEPYGQQQVNSAIKRISAEMGISGDAVDGITSEEVSTEVIYGSDTRIGAPFASINKYATEDQQRPHVDFIKHLKTAMRRDSEDAIRRKIDDPHIGPRFRAFQRNNPDMSTDELVHAYNKSGVSDRIGFKRAEKALKVVASGHATPIDGEILERLEAGRVSLV